MSEYKIKTCRDYLEIISLNFLSFFTIILWILLGYILAIIPDIEWFTFSAVKDWIISLKLLDIIQWFIQYLLVPTITLVLSQKLYKQWQYDQFVKLVDRIITAESKYIEKMEYYYKYMNNELPDDIKLLESDKEHYIIEYLGELEFLALSILQYKVVGYKIAKEHLQYIILACFDEEQQKDLAIHLQNTINNNNKGYYIYLYKLYNLYKIKS
ncbi:MAG: hypothetical protein ACRCTJ_01105 [Brevinema sp.]